MEAHTDHQLRSRQLGVGGFLPSMSLISNSYLTIFEILVHLMYESSPTKPMNARKECLHKGSRYHYRAHYYQEAEFWSFAKIIEKGPGYGEFLL